MDPDPNRPSAPERPTYESPASYGDTGPPQAAPPGAAAPSPSGPTNGFAIASLVLGILGLIGFPPLIPSILALIFGYKGKREIDRSLGFEQGRGLAVAGIILGWIAVVFTLVFAIAAIVLFALPSVSVNW